MRVLTTILHQLFRYRKKLISSLDNKNSVYCINFRVFSHTSSLYQWGKNKKHRNVKLQWYFDKMDDPKVEEILAPLRANVKEQVSKCRQYR